MRALRVCLGIFFSMLFVSSASALDCGSYNNFSCSGNENQFSGGFQSSSGFGGFGGGNCTATKTPVIFIHGNGDNAIAWDATPFGSANGFPIPDQSVYEVFKSQGYNDCELFGVTYLSQSQRSKPADNYHHSAPQEIINDFIESVKVYTGKDQVDIVSHSMGVSMALSALSRFDNWDSIRRFVNIAGGVRGLQACRWMGYANPLAPTCGGQNIYDSHMFGFYPSTGALYVSWGRNDWTGSSGSRSMRRAPAYHSNVNFYTLHAGHHDQIHCSTLLGFSVCDDGARFNSYSNVKSQLNLGAGSLAVQYDYDFSDNSPTNLAGGDADGLGHFNVKINTGKVLHRMLTTNCTGSNCASNYDGPVSQ